MPLVDWLHDRWRDIRAERLRGEESRQQVFESLNAQEKDRACQEIAQWLKQADIKAENTVNKVSPLLEVIGVLAIPFVLFYYESQQEARQLELEKQREERQLEFEQNLISAQAEVRKQQAVRDYLSQITTIYLDVKDRDEIKQNEDLKKLLEATTLAIFDELSVSEHDLEG